MSAQQGKIELPLRFYDVLARIIIRIAREDLQREQEDAEKAAQAQPQESA